MNFVTVPRFSLLLAFFLSSALIATAMPPHPELVESIRNGEIENPYYLRHRAELTAQGLNTSEHTRSLRDILSRSLDTDMNILAIIVDFSDNTAHTQATLFDTLLVGGGRGSLRNYYSEVSYGNLNLTCINLPGMLGWQRAPQSYQYYVNGQNGFGNYPRNAQRLAEDAVQLVNPVVDFSQYDNDGDGEVDALFIIHAGQGAERTGNDNHIWSHKWSMRNAQNVDGVMASTYSMEPEYWVQPGDMTCGVYAHEMGHAVFGLPDFYDYDYDSEGLGRWSLMAGGSWNGALGNSPAHPDAWGRIQMGFLNAVNITTDIPYVQIPDIESSPTIYRLWTNGQQGQEYFLVENRQQSGYDIALPGNGLLIYHVDDSRRGNDDQWYPGYTGNGHYQVAIEPADGQWDMEHNANSGDDGDPFPGWQMHRHFTALTVPNSNSYNNTITNVAVRRISPSADTMTAGFYVGSNPNTVFTYLPDTTCLAGGQICIPIRIENNISSQNVTRVDITISYDTTIIFPTNPYFSIDNGLIPSSWTVEYSLGTDGFSLHAQGTTSLSGQGELACIIFTVPSGIAEGTRIPLSFNNCQFNTGTPAADTTNGSIRVIAPLISTTPELLDFEYVRVGEPAVRGMVIRNMGSAPLTVLSAETHNIFIHDFEGPQIIEPNLWYPLRIRLNPTAIETYRDTLAIYSNAAAGTIYVPIQAVGALPQIQVQPMMLHFDSTSVAEESSVQLNVIDTGHWELELTGAEFTIGNAFRIEPASWPTTVPANDTVSFTVYFSPTELGLVLDTLILSHDAGEAVRIPLAGIARPNAADNIARSAIPSDFYLSQNYPNPFNPSTVIEYGLPITSQVAIRVFNVAGREVAQLVDQRLPAGNYQATWNAKNEAAGVYFIAMTTDHFSTIRKAFLIK